MKDLQKKIQWLIDQVNKLRKERCEEDPSECECDTTPINITYNESQVNITNNTLIPGSFYLMTDFKTVYDQPDYLSITTPKTTVVTKTGRITPILLLATSTNTFAKEVWMPERPDWVFEYDINFSVTEYMNSPALGRITYARDNKGNETLYDHDVVLLKRYYLPGTPSGLYYSYWDTGEISTEVKTFNGRCSNNTINRINFEGRTQMDISNLFLVSNNSFNERSNFNVLGFGCTNNSFGESSLSNVLESNCNGNILETEAIRHVLKPQCQFNHLKNLTSAITLNALCENLKFPSNSKNNEVKSNISTIDFTVGTHILEEYHCEIFKRQDETVRLSYINNSDALTVVSPTS